MCSSSRAEHCRAPTPDIDLQLGLPGRRMPPPLGEWWPRGRAGYASPMNTRTLASALVLGCVAIASPACSGGRVITGDPISVRTISGDWRLVSVGGDEVAPMLEAEGEAPTLRIGEDGRLSGLAGVNRIAGALDTEALLSGRWATGELVATKMAGPEELMKLEGRVLKALSQATSAKLENGTLTLAGRGGETLVYTSER